MALLLIAVSGGWYHASQKVAMEPVTPTSKSTSDEDRAAGRGSSPAVAETVKGWVRHEKGGIPANLPAGARILEDYEGQSFVEIPAGAVGALRGLGIRFRPLPEADVLSVGSARFDVRGDGPPVDKGWRAGPPSQSGRRPYLVKFEAPARPEWLAEIREAGAEIIQYQPHFGYLMLAPPGIESRLDRIGRVAFHDEYHPGFKAEASLLARAARNESITLRVVYFDLPGYEQEIDAALARGARLGHLADGASTSHWALLHYVIYEDVKTRDLQAILRAPHVYWAEEWFPPQLEGERAAQIAAGNLATGQPVIGYSAWLAGLGADGTGVTVAIADSGLDTGNPGAIHEDFQGRVAFSPICALNRDRDGHGTNVAAIAVGDPRSPPGTGLTDPDGFFWGMGSAPRAGLFFQKALDPYDCGSTFNAEANILAQDAVTNGGAQIGSHSFTDGLGDGSSYNSQAQAWDARVRDADTGLAGNQPYAVHFSAGNSGPSASSLTSPKAAKNIITVGATENYRPGQCPGVSGCGGPADDVDALVSFSSRGPTTDGRIKPDVSAPGHTIAGAKSSQATYSCYCDTGTSGGCCASVGVDGSDKYTAYSGTSQASPRAAGASAIVHEWYKDRFAVFPSPAMNKAILINGATDMKTADVPNNNEGWGRINLSTSLQSPTGSVYVDQSTVIGDTGDPAAFTATYFTQDPDLGTKTNLVWTDPPGSVGCSPCLVNDMDLIVTQGASTWLGNNFSGGLSVTGGTEDSLNNIEGVHLASGTLGCTSFDVKVRAQALNGDGVPGNGDSTDQDFALVVSNAATTAGPPILRLTNDAVSGGCDADGFLDRRETADLVLDLRNAGCTEASGLEATVSVDSQPAGASVTVFPSGPVALGTLVSDGTLQQSWQIELADNASSFCGEKAVFRIDITDSGAGAWSDTVEVVLDADSFGSVILTDNADTDNSFSKDPDWALDDCRTSSPSSSWHMGDSDCTGIPRDGANHDLIFEYTVATSDVIKELSFQHAFGGYSNTSFQDSIQVDIDPMNDGSFVTLQSWRSGIDNPTSVTPAGPFDLTPFNAVRGNTIKIRFRFTSAGAWAGSNTASGWDVDDITFVYDTITCDAGSCPTCTDPTGLTNNGAADLLNCLLNGIEVTWDADVSSWGDEGMGTRSYTIIRDSVPLASGGCSGSIAYGNTSCVDDTTSPGVSHNYKVRYENGCGLHADTTGASAIDTNEAPPPVNDGSSGGNPVTVSYSGGQISLTWDHGLCALAYNLYMGSVDTYWSHAIFTATGLDGTNSCAEPANSVTFADPGGNLYFLVTAMNEYRESTYGVSTVQNPRPRSDPACSPP